MYSATSELTKAVCGKMGFIFDIHFVEAMQRNGKVYVRGTLGKPDEFYVLRCACQSHGYIYKGKN